MNIEEERKAFLIHFLPACCLNFSDGKWSTSNASIYQENVLVIACVRWESWLAAKEHAEEMAKPECRIEQDSDGGWWIRTTLMRKGIFSTRGVAIKRAEKDGLRVLP